MERNDKYQKFIEEASEFIDEFGTTDGGGQLLRLAKVAVTQVWPLNWIKNGKNPLISAIRDIPEEGELRLELYEGIKRGLIAPFLSNIHSLHSYRDMVGMDRYQYELSYAYRMNYPMATVQLEFCETKELEDPEEWSLYESEELALLPALKPAWIESKPISNEVSRAVQHQDSENERSMPEKTAMFPLKEKKETMPETPSKGVGQTPAELLTKIFKKESVLPDLEDQTTKKPLLPLIEGVEEELPRVKVAQPEQRNLAEMIAGRLTSRIFCAAPRTGKGVLIYQSLMELVKIRPDVELWAIDIKNDPGENGYYSIFSPERLLRVNLMGYDVDEASHRAVDKLFRKFNQSTAVTKLLWMNECVTMSARLDPPLWKNIKDFIVALCSAGATGNEGQTGRFIWMDTQSPNTSSMGLGTNAARNVFRRTFLMNSDQSLLKPAVSCGFSEDINPYDILDMMDDGTKVIAYDSLSNAWHKLPVWNAPKAEQPALTVKKETHEFTNP